MSLLGQFDHLRRPLVAPLSHFGHKDLLLAGGKGANLGELSRGGFDIPAGFVITTAAYDLLLRNRDLRSRLDTAVAALEPDQPEALTKISRNIRDLFENISVPQVITDEVMKAYHRLGSAGVAVRSSATAEDLPEAAFAGQQETFLNVIGEGALLEAVHACWASLWSERAILYRARQNVDQASVKLAVVVQRMVPADAAGVMFTADPVSGLRDVVLIDANPGLGEAVVSGAVTPDHYVVAKRSKRIKEQTPGRREVIIRAKAGGGTEQVTSDRPQVDEAALPKSEIKKLAQLGIKIETFYRMHQDIEWAWIKETRTTGKFFILQARPITALPEPLKVNGAMRLIVPMLAEMWPVRPYPLDMTTFTGAVEHSIGNLLAAMLGKGAPNPGEALLEEDGVVVRFEPPKFHPSPVVLIHPLLALWRTRHYDPSRWEADPLLREYISSAHELDGLNPGSLTWEQNIAALHEALELIPQGMKVRELYLPRAFLGLGQLWMLLKLARRGDAFSELVSGVRTKTTETNLALEVLAAQARAEPELRDIFSRNEARQLGSVLKGSPAGQAFLQDFNNFLNQYGHRETALTISEPAWKDQPEIVFGILKVLAGVKPNQEQSNGAWQRTRDDLLAGSILGRKPLRNLFLKSLGNARALFQIREDTHFYVTLLQPPIRHIALELGQRLEKAGALETGTDIFHLRLEELESVGDTWSLPADTLARIRTLVWRRKARRESLAGRPMVDPRLLAIAPRTDTEQDVLLSGSSGSPGAASGPARIILDPSEFGKLQHGDVLVAPVTNPAWTPLFQHAAAVVVDTGGSASHAAIVAREYGVPAVMGTVNGTQQLQDGQWVRVDGSRGLVLKAEEPK